MSQIDPSSMQSAIDAVIYKYRIRQSKNVYTPLDELIHSEEIGEKKDQELISIARQEAFEKLLGYFFANGFEPLAVIRRVYAVAKAIKPELLADMSLEDLALLCGDGCKQTVSARIERIYNGYIKEHGGSSTVRASFQKSISAKISYSQAQKGNSNRKGKFKKK